MTADWIQHDLTLADRATAERLAAHRLAPALTDAQNSGELRDWWYMRKAPFRLRYRARLPAPTVVMLLDALVQEQSVERWSLGIYEPETEAFGGPEAMEVAHRLFHSDSRHLLARAAGRATSTLGPAETVVVLAGAMLRAAGLDWYEQGDVWAQFAALRPAPPSIDSECAATLSAAAHRLMSVDTRRLTQDGGPLTYHAAWVGAFEEAGQDLVRLARDGRLTRGLRAVLAHQLLFHANRAGLPTSHQAAMAASMLNAVFYSGESPALSQPTIRTTTRVAHVTTLSDSAAVPTSAQLRDSLTDRLIAQQSISSTAVENAFRAVPRERFLPGFPLEAAYADNPNYTKADGSGTQISAASQPGIVALMLEQLAARPGERIFEAGAGTGVNAAYLATLVGPQGHVVTVDVDDDLVDGARKHLADAGITNVEVVRGDGALGHPDGAPYDRVIATVSTSEMPTTWLQQVRPTGRIVLPLRLRGTASRTIGFERRGDGWASVDDQLAVFMPLRGSMDDARRTVALTGEGDVTLQVHKDQADVVDGTALLGVLDHDRHEHWTGVTIPAGTTYEYQDLWLACTLPNSLMRMSVTDMAHQRGVARMFGWGSMATVHDGSLAYLTLRPGEPSEDGRKTYETGVIGHGPDGEALADLVVQEIRTWDRGFRDRAPRFELPDNPAGVASDLAVGRFILDRPHRPITVIWE
ncbi:methyltransferase, FxLD system [Kitasatospora sp. NBC_01250]|uniref:methyltransferase, FxLD system n=1 Tax=Kitasatospora sp. NBC_01250 TaxID=2903571 RepID=UPI002E340CBD|nr:methyltransferase, FxLD system [Kitasatospora sp. NBC_01250]